MQLKININEVELFSINDKYEQYHLICIIKGRDWVCRILGYHKGNSTQAYMKQKEEEHKVTKENIRTVRGMMFNTYGKNAVDYFVNKNYFAYIFC